MMTIWRLILVGILLCAAPLGAFADDLGRTKINLREHKTDNFVLFADEVTHNNNSNTTTARGNVQIVSEPYVLTADGVSYSPDQDLMTARGHVRLMQQQQPGAAPTEVLFTDYLELSANVSTGKFMNIKMLFSDNSRLIARDGKRYTNKENSELTELHDVVYSPCDLCKDDPTKPPLWQMKADRFVHDTDAQEMRYYDATMEFDGVPFFYTPYFAHGDPTAKQEPGFLNPEYLSTPYLGAFIRNFYYQPISPSEDMTFELSESTAQGPVAGFEWRERFDKAKIKIYGAATDSDLQTQTGTRTTTRGYLGLDALWDINSMWRAGADIKYTGDKTFLQQYKYDGSDILTDRVYAERFNGRSYGAINAYGFQDLRPNQTGDQPNLLPAMSYSDYGKPGGTLGGRWGVNTSFIGITRPYGGQSVQRLSGSLDWQRQWISNFGLKSVLTLNTRGDSYQVQDGAVATAGTARAGDSYGINRSLANANWQSSIPFVKNGQYLQYQIEPIVAFTATSRVKNATVPDEDSQELELDASNLFNPSRYPGLDRIEDGQRLTYGARAGVTNRNGGYYSVFAGQSDRLSGNNNMPVGSGLSQDLSDIVGEVNAIPSKYLDLDYHIRATHDTLAAQRHEVSISAGPEWLRVNSNYAFLKDIPLTDLNQTHNQITNSITAKLTDKWQVFAQDQKDLDHQPKSLITQGGLKYMDECFSVTISYERNYTERIGLDSGDSFYVSVGFKNLGTYGSTAFNSLSQTPILTVPGTSAPVPVSNANPTN